MVPFTYSRATDPAAVPGELSAQPKTKILGGGTNLIDLMKQGVETPTRLLDITRLPLAGITELPDNKGVRLGALSRNSDVAAHPLIRDRYPALSQAILAGASPQLRNSATTGGNLLQRTRCYYFYEPNFPACNKRNPGSGCGAIDGYNRIHGILGTSDRCIATHPSDMCVALAALDATVRISGPRGERELAFTDFHRLPGDHPEKDANLEPDELITSVDLPTLPWAKNSRYLKVRDRASYAFAIVSVACALEIENHTIKTARLALGGVAHKPWRSKAAEEKLLNEKPTPALFQAAADAALADAKGYKYNTFKIELARRTITRALAAVSGHAAA